MRNNVKKIVLSYLVIGGVFFIGCAKVNADANDKYITAAKTCVDNLIKYGRDTYGEIKSPIFVSILDVNSRSCPQKPLELDEKWRVIRGERRNPAGANLFADQMLLKTMYALSDITGVQTYADEANKCLDYYLKNLVDKKGLIWWGGHRHYDVYEDKMTGHLLNWHEIHESTQVQWQYLWNVNPDAVKKQMEATWQWHVINKQTGEINRHDDGVSGCDFPLTGGSFIDGFAFMYAKTNDPNWLNRAILVANYFWELRNKDTNLLAERPNAGSSRFDGAACATDITGPYCHGLIGAYLLTKQEIFKEQALAYLAAYNKYGFDEKAGMFYGCVKLDGTPILGPRLPADDKPEQFGNNQQYAQYEPRGYLDLWEPYTLGSEYPLETAQCYALAYRLTKDPNMLLAAQRFADWIEKTPTTAQENEISWYAEYKKTFGKAGTYADKYGRAISFFIDMYVIKNDKKYLHIAQQFADEAVAKLYVNGMFKGHPAKPYYESVDGVGNLLYALVELDQALKGKLQSFDLNNW